MVDIFQAKLDKLLSDIEGIKTCIDNILVSFKESFSKNINKLRLIFGRLSATGLKVNAPKFSFGLKDIPYIVYVITQDGIKPDPKKLQSIMDLVRPNTATKVRPLIGMVHYYRDMWPKWSHILAHMTEASSGPKVRKTL